MNFEQSKKFIYKNARPLDIARWKYLFEGGSREAVLKALAVYQNEDGGFGSALEPDFWNPNSSPMQTWVATEIVKEVKLEDRDHPVIQGILRYLGSGRDFDGHTWSNTVPTNNDYPHAPWWEYSSAQENSYNPTACLIGFILKYAEEDSKVYETGWKLAREAYAYFKTHFPIESMHTVSCFVELYEYIKECAIVGLLDVAEFKILLSSQIRHVITYDTEKWAVDYVCKPSLFISSKTSDFYMENKQICDYECSFISNTQEPDGTWSITWEWEDYPEEWNISRNWWKADWIIKNIRFSREMQS